MEPLDDRARDFFRGLQDRITAAIEAADGGGQFREDAWSRPGGGGGRTRVLAGGALFEKAGVDFSDVHGELRPEMAKRAARRRARLPRHRACRSCFHPKSPRVPTVHANVRHIQRGARSWFGGGTDLTPYYVVPEDAASLPPHAARLPATATIRASTPLQELVRRVLLPAAPERDARRRRHLLRLPGAGAEMTAGQPAATAPSASEADAEAMFAFVRDVGDAILPAYLPIVEQRRERSLGRARARLAAPAARALRRVQPALRSRHGLRPAHRRSHRIDPDVAAARGALGLRARARARQPRSRVAGGDLRPPRLGRGLTPAALGAGGGAARSRAPVASRGWWGGP